MDSGSSSIWVELGLPTPKCLVPLIEILNNVLTATISKFLWHKYFTKKIWEMRDFIHS